MAQALKNYPVLQFVYSNQSSGYGATTIVKVSFFSTWTRSNVSFHFMLSVEIDSYSSEQIFGNLAPILTFTSAL